MPGGRRVNAEKDVAQNLDRSHWHSWETLKAKTWARKNGTTNLGEDVCEGRDSR